MTETISVLLPSRGRPQGVERLAQSISATTSEPLAVETIVVVDADDPFLAAYVELWERSPRMRCLIQPRSVLSSLWNRAYEIATGEIVMQCGDDIVFRTPGWDDVVRGAFREVDDRILLAYGDDLGPNGQTAATHGFVHRKWVEAVGYFLPPIFSCDWADVWLDEVADMIGRKQLLPIVTEHLHYTFGKAERDRTHIEREERGKEDDAYGLFKRTALKRLDDAAKLRMVMTS